MRWTRYNTVRLCNLDWKSAQIWRKCACCHSAPSWRCTKGHGEETKRPKADTSNQWAQYGLKCLWHSPSFDPLTNPRQPRRIQPTRCSTMESFVSTVQELLATGTYPSEEKINKKKHATLAPKARNTLLPLRQFTVKQQYTTRALITARKPAFPSYTPKRPTARRPNRYLSATTILFQTSAAILIASGLVVSNASVAVEYAAPCIAISLTKPTQARLTRVNKTCISSTHHINMPTVPVPTELELRILLIQPYSSASHVSVFQKTCAS